MDLVLRRRHLELVDLREREVAARLQRLELALGDGDAALLGLRAVAHLDAADVRGARLVATRAHVVQELRGAGAGLHEIGLARERALGDGGGRLGLADVGLGGREVPLPRLAREHDALVGRADVAVRDRELLRFERSFACTSSSSSTATTASAGTASPSANFTSRTRPVTSLRSTRSSPSTKPGVVVAAAATGDRRGEAQEQDERAHGHLGAGRMASSGRPSTCCSSARRVCAW
jgi:hypothetical protein